MQNTQVNQKNSLEHSLRNKTFKLVSNESFGDLKKLNFPNLNQSEIKQTLNKTYRKKQFHFLNPD